MKNSFSPQAKPLTIFASIIALSMLNIACGSDSSNSKSNTNNTTDNSSTSNGSDSDDSTSGNSNGSNTNNTNDLLANIPLTSANNFDYYDFYFSNEYEKVDLANYYLGKESGKVVNGKFSAGITSIDIINKEPAVDNDSHLLTLVGKDFFTTTKEETGLDAIYGTDKQYIVWKDSSNSNQVMITSTFAKSDLSGLGIDNETLRIEELNDIKGSSNLSFPNNSYCWAESSRKLSRSVFTLDLDDPEKESDVQSWVANSDIKQYITSQETIKVGSNNEYTATLFTLVYPNTTQEFKTGVVQIGSKLYAGNYAQANTSYDIPKETGRTCEFYNKTAWDFIAEKAPGLYAEAK